MMETILNLLNISKEFFQIGLFSFGGGYSTLPFLYALTDKYMWFTPNELSQMIAVATITPGPVGINVATYAGMKAGGVLTAMIATSSEVLPALFIGIGISKLLKKFSDNFYVQSAIWALKPTSCALLTFVAMKLIYQNIIVNPHIVIGSALFGFMLAISILKTKDPLWYISVSAIFGAILVKTGII